MERHEIFRYYTAARGGETRRNVKERTRLLEERKDISYEKTKAQTGPHGPEKGRNMAETTYRPFLDPLPKEPEELEKH